MLTAPTLTTIGAKWEQIDASIYEHSSYALATFGFKAEAGGLAMARTAVKEEATGLSVSRAGCSITLNGSHFTEEGVDLSNKGPEIHVVAILVIT